MKYYKDLHNLYYKEVLNNIQNNIHLSMREDSGENIENIIREE